MSRALELPVDHNSAQCGKRSCIDISANLEEAYAETIKVSDKSTQHLTGAKKMKAEANTHPITKKTAVTVHTHPKNMSVAIMPATNDQEVKLESLRGNYWKTMGHSCGGMNLLHLEEALYLVEKRQLLIKDNIDYECADECTSENEADKDLPPQSIQYIESRQFYEHVVKSISLECYLTYLKLKSLDYVVHRSGDGEVRLFGEEMNALGDFKKQLSHYRAHAKERMGINGSNEEPTLLSFMSSYDIYLVGDNYTKRNAAAGLCVPVAHVIVTTCPKLYSPTLILTLLKQSRGTPCLFAVVMPHTGFVMLEEMTDAEQSLSWDFGLISRITASECGDEKQKEQLGIGDQERDDSNKEE